MQEHSFFAIRALNSGIEKQVLGLGGADDLTLHIPEKRQFILAA